MRDCNTSRCQDSFKARDSSFLSSFFWYSVSFLCVKKKHHPRHEPDILLHHWAVPLAHHLFILHPSHPPQATSFSSFSLSSHDSYFTAARQDQSEPHTGATQVAGHGPSWCEPSSWALHWHPHPPCACCYQSWWYWLPLRLRLRLWK